MLRTKVWIKISLILLLKDNISQAQVHNRTIKFLCTFGQNCIYMVCEMQSHSSDNKVHTKVHVKGCMATPYDVT